MASEAQTKPSDLILRLRLDALRKNLKQIMGMRKEILARRTEVEKLHVLAKDQRKGIEWRLRELEQQIRVALESIDGLERDGVAEERLEAPKRALGAAQNLSTQISQGFPQMVDIIREMALRWDQIANDRIPEELGEEAEVRYKEVEALQRSLRGLSGQAPVSPEAIASEAIWDRYEWMAFGNGESLFGEYVDVIGGLALRNTGVDGGTCQMADDLLLCLHSAWRSRGSGSLAVPTRKMAPARSAAQIVRLGFPEWTVWAVPLGAHEFGHVALGASEELMAQARSLAISPAELETYLADAFGAAALGPAYGCALVLLALDPCKADQERREQTLGTEPERTQELSPDSRRLHVVLEVFKLMGEAEGEQAVSAVGESLREAWGNALDGFGLSVDAAWDEELQACAKLVWQHLNARAPQLPYQASRFATVARWEDLRDYAPTDFPGVADDVRDILNAVWTQRLKDLARHEDRDPVELATAARELWRARLGGEGRTRELHTDVRGP